MTAELKVMTSNFGADESKGPVVISAIGKSGGQQFHGEAYLYSRYYTLNANDPQNKNSNIARPETKYFYPGFQIGGPVILPHTGFNRGRDKMFFFLWYRVLQARCRQRRLSRSSSDRCHAAGNFAELRANPPNGLGCPYYTLNADGKDYTQHAENCYSGSLTDTPLPEYQVAPTSKR